MSLFANLQLENNPNAILRLPGEAAILGKAKVCKENMTASFAPIGGFGLQSDSESLEAILSIKDTGESYNAFGLKPCSGCSEHWDMKIRPC